MTKEQYNELYSILKGLETRMTFIEQDLQELKDSTINIGDGVIGLAVTVANMDKTKSADSNKTARLEEFRKETARWG